MSGQASKNFNLPYHQYDEYWVCVYGHNNALPPVLAGILKEQGMQALASGAMGVKTGKDWKKSWDNIYTQIQQANALETVDTAVLPGDADPLSSSAQRKGAAAMQELADSLWLGQALLDDRILCYMQPVVSQRDKIFGYESFARVAQADGGLISGLKIIAASRALGIEYMIDRHLQVQAIKTFVASDFDGFLFINFFPGFIHRPAVYLEGLSETVKQYGIVAKHIVLDFTQSEAPRDIAHLRSVCEYGRSKGYSIALDDIGTFDGARKLLPEIKPDFVKIDMHLARKAAEPEKRETIRKIIEAAHASGASVIGEGVETEEMYQNLKHLGVDLFQGYYFSPPVPVEKAMKKSTAI
jgi:EAL domain-containing protein (putative c-di-GMP-specific phosphodiesterase class I)